jgi:transposase
VHWRRGWRTVKGKNRMEKQEARDNEHDQAARMHLVMLMQAGYPWHKAAATAGLHISRSTAYRLVEAVQTRGEVAFQDRRHGHPTKLREAVLQWLRAFCHSAPQTSSREVQAALQEQFGIQVSIGHLNRVRAQLGIGNHVGRLKKNSKRPVLHRNPNGKRVQAHCCLSPLHTRQDCWKP